MSTSEAMIIFDGDDTLWKTQPIYKSIIDEFYATLTQQGFDSVEYRSLFSQINASLLDDIKLSSERLGKAMVATYLTLCQNHKMKSNKAMTEWFIELAGQVYTRAPVPMDGLRDVLSLLADQYKLAFYSGGGTETQLGRLRQLDLEHFFQERLYIVTQKDGQTLRSVLESLSIQPEETWIVGNSPRFEINPGVQLGIHTIWMYTSFWKLELEDIARSRTHVAFSLTEAANAIIYGSGWGAKQYAAPESSTHELQAAVSQSGTLKETWVIGSSPKLDINPAISLGAIPVWVPSAVGVEDIEPFVGPTYVAFSPKGAEEVMKLQASEGINPSKALWRIRDGDGTCDTSIVVD